MSITKQLMGLVDFHIMEKILWKSMAHQLFEYPYSSLNDDRTFFFSVSYPFKPHIPAYPYSRKEKNKVTFSTSQFAFLNRAILNLA